MVQVVQLLKDAGDSPSQILLSEAILKPMLDDTFDLLLVKKPDAIASSSSQEEPQSDDNDDHLHDEGLGRVLCAIIIFRLGVYMNYDNIKTLQLMLDSIRKSL